MAANLASTSEPRLAVEASLTTTPVSPAPSTNFDGGVPDDGSVTPPDADGAVGPAHVMTALSSGFSIQSKTGSGATSVAVADWWQPGSSSSLTGSSGTPYCPSVQAIAPVGVSATPAPSPIVVNSSAPVFSDPRLRFDSAAGHWLLSEMCDPLTTQSTILLAVSETADPTGVWDRYALRVDPTGVVQADYDSLGFNSKWVVVTINAAGGAAGTRLYAFGKANLYAGPTQGGGSFSQFLDANAFAQMPAVTMDPLQATMYLLENGDGSQSQLRLSTITGDVGSEIYTFRTVTLSLGSWFDCEPNSTNTAEGGFAPQMGSPLLIETGDSRIQSVVVRNGTLWAAQTVFLPGPASGSPACPGTAATPSQTRSSVQWMQLDPTACTAGTGACQLQAGRVDDSTGATFYAYPSLAVNARNDMMIGYSSFSATRFASGDYSFRYGYDAPGTLRGDTVYKAGLASYAEGIQSSPVGAPPMNSWGDYSAAAVDPTDDTSLWTVQEYASTPTTDPNSPYQSLGRWGTWWAKVAFPTTIGDFDADHRTDITVFRPSTGTWYTLNSSGTPLYTATLWGAAGDTAVPADYDGTGRDQIAVFRPSSGTWYILHADGSYAATVWGAQGDIPVPADYDGTGRAQIAIFRPSTGTWYILHADGSYAAKVWGAQGDIPVPADYDGAGRAQIAVFRPSTGSWYVLHADGSYAAKVWGAQGDIPVPSDYDRAGVAQIAIYRPSSGTWWVLHGDGSYTPTLWGVSGDVPEPGDYNRDGMTDVTVYRPSTGQWYTLLSGGGGAYTAATWGSSGDVPVVLPAAVRT